jgi:hypothetical protein
MGITKGLDGSRSQGRVNAGDRQREKHGILGLGGGSRIKTTWVKTRCDGIGENRNLHDGLKFLDIMKNRRAAGLNASSQKIGSITVSVTYQFDLAKYSFVQALK